jgi:hypothetical protein
MNRVAIVRGEERQLIAGATNYPHTIMTLVRDHVGKKFYYRFNNTVTIRTLDVKSASSGSSATIDSAARPLVVPMGSPEILPLTGFKAAADGSIYAEMAFPGIATSAEKTVTHFVFAKDQGERLLCFNNGKGWISCDNGKLTPCNEAGSDGRVIRISIDGELLGTHPGMRVFAGYGISGDDMFVKGNFSQVFTVPVLNEPETTAFLATLRAQIMKRK